MKSKRFLLSILMILSFSIQTNALTEIKNLRTEYLQNPIGLDKTHPRFSWEIQSSNRGVKQVAWQITVSTDQAGLNPVWNSGKVKTDRSVNNRYQGPALTASTRYYWHVDVWCEDKLFSSTETSFFETGLMNSGWGEAKWIKAPFVGDADSGILLFRKAFETAKKEIKSAKLYSSALGVYDLFLNGKRVGNLMENGKMVYDELKPGWTDYSKTVQYTTYEVGSFLQKGANALSAQVASGWWKGPVSNGEYGNPELSFIAKMDIHYTDGTTQTIETDNAWKTSTDGSVRMADIYHGETYDARKDNHWKTTAFNDASWSDVVLSTGFKGQLKAFTGPSVQVRSNLTRRPTSITIYRDKKEDGSTFGSINTLKVLKKSKPIRLKKGETVVYDMGQNMVGWVKFTAKSTSGTELKIRFGEMLNDTGQSAKGNDGPAGSIYTANYRSAKSTLRYIFKGSKEGETYKPSLTFFGFRYCELTATDNVEIKALTGEVVGSATEEGSSFKTSDPSINQLYSNILWGQRSNYLSIPTDCPQRDERLGWTGDTQIFSRAATYNADVAAFFQKWMGDMRDSQRKDGAYPDVAPHAWVGYGQAAWGDAGLIVPWNIYLMYEDLDILTENYASMERYMGFLTAQAGNGYRYNGAGTNYGDWVSYEETDKRFISVCYYAYAAQLMSRISGVLSQNGGDAFDMKQAKYGSLYQKIKNEFNKRYIQADGSLVPTSQTAYLLALKLGLFPNETARKKGVDFLCQKIATNGNRLSTGFVGTGILNQTLSQCGADQTAYNLLLQRNNPSWLYSVDQGATTIWERWNSYTLDKGFGDVSMNSFNHYAYGAVGEWMFRNMAGIEVDESQPGFKQIILQPTPDTRATIPDGQKQVTMVDATYNSYYGPIKSSWKLSKSGYHTYAFSIPANTTATLYLPVIDSTLEVYEGAVPAATAKGVTFVKKEGQKRIYKLESGSYNFMWK